MATNQQEGVVLEVNGKMAKVKSSRHNDCKNCGACPGNSALVLDARNTVGAKSGQRVTIEVREVNMLKAAFIVYVLPLIAAFLGAIAGGFVAEPFALPETFSRIAGGMGAFLLAVWYIKYFDGSTRMDEKMQPTITRILT